MSTFSEDLVIAAMRKKATLCRRAMYSLLDFVPEYLVGEIEALIDGIDGVIATAAIYEKATDDTANTSVTGETPEIFH